MKKKSKPLVLKKLEESFGVIKTACKKAAISRDTFYRWCEEDPKFKEGVEKAIGGGKMKRLDIALSHHIEKLEEGEDKAVYFELTRRHPDYIQKIKAMLEGKVEIQQKIRVDPIFKKAVKFYEDQLKKEYRRIHRRKHPRLDKKKRDKKRKRKSN